MIHHRPKSIRGRLPLAALFFVLASSLTSSAVAQQIAPQTQPAASPSTKTVAAVRPPAPSPGVAPIAAAQAAPAVSQEQALYLVRATLLTLNDANRSGNYSVLRDLAAPGFQAKNTAADLAQIFADLRRRNFDLFSVALIDPQFAPAPALDGEGRLHLTGVFPTRPLQISFDLTFQSTAGQWRLFAISVATPEAPRTQSQVNAPPRRRSPGPVYGFRVLSGTLGWRW